MVQSLLREVQYTQESGSTGSEMVRVNKSGLTDQSTKEVGCVDASKARELTSMRTVTAIRVNGSKTRNTAKVRSSTRQALNILATG